MSPRALLINRRRLALAFTASLTVLAMTAWPVAADHDGYRRISAGQINGNGPFIAGYQGLSDDGRRVFFLTSEQLVSSDTDSEQDLYQRFGGKTTLISAGQINGNGPYGASFDGSSADGSHVFFETNEQLVAADTDDSEDVYQRFNGVTTRISVGTINGNDEFNAQFKDASADGSRVFFETDEQLVAGDTDDNTDVYQRANGTTKRMSKSAVSGDDDGGVHYAGSSADGTIVFMRTTERMVAGDSDDNDDIYMRKGKKTSRVSLGTINGNGDFEAEFQAASADGSKVFFETEERLLANDTDSATDIYQRANGVTTRVTVGAINGNGDFFTSFDAVSADGTRVFFHSPEQLVAADTDGATDIYQRFNGATTLISAGAINGNAEEQASFAAMSADGTRVFFETDEQLVAADTDAERDIYQRAGGVTTLISAGEINGNGAFEPEFDAVSADGTRVFFTTAEVLVPGDGDTVNDVYERYDGVTSVLSLGDLNNNVSFLASSKDGSAVFMQVLEPWLPNDTDSEIDIYGAYTSP